MRAAYRCSILGFDIIVSLVVVEFVLQGVMPLNKLLKAQSIKTYFRQSETARFF